MKIKETINWIHGFAELSRISKNGERKGKKCEAKEMKMKGETISSYELCPATSIVT
jgi:hypothetical protein